MLEYWTFSKEDFPSVQIQVERADTWLGRFCGLMMRKGDVTKFIPTKRALPRIIWSGAEPFVL